MVIIFLFFYFLYWPFAGISLGSLSKEIIFVSIKILGTVLGLVRIGVRFFCWFKQYFICSFTRKQIYITSNVLGSDCKLEAYTVHFLVYRDTFSFV